MVEIEEAVEEFSGTHSNHLLTPLNHLSDSHLLHMNYSTPWIHNSVAIHISLPLPSTLYKTSVTGESRHSIRIAPSRRHLHWEFFSVADFRLQVCAARSEGDARGVH